MSVKVVKLPEDISKDMRRLMKESPMALGEALWDETTLIMNESQNQCPIEFGVLRASGRVEDPIIKPGVVKVVLAYGKALPVNASRWEGITQYKSVSKRPDYAVYVHENLEAFHPYGKAKFLEDPLAMRLSFNIIPHNVILRMNKMIEVV